MPNSKIFIFSGEEDYERNIAIRTCMEAFGIQEIVLINVNYAISKLVSCKDNVIASVEKNKCRFPIIFYGGNENKYNTLVKLCDFGNRKDIGWIPNLHNPTELLEATREIRDRFVL